MLTGACLFRSPVGNFSKKSSFRPIQSCLRRFRELQNFFLRITQIADKWAKKVLNLNRHNDNTLFNQLKNFQNLSIILPPKVGAI
jgi:hypothetical protein